MGLRDAMRWWKLKRKWDGFRRVWRSDAPIGVKMTGFRTFLIAALAAVATILHSKGIILEQNDQAAIATGIMTVVLIVQRFKTRSPVSWSSSTLVYMILGALASVLQAVGIGLPEDQQAALATGVLALLGVIARAATKTPPGTGVEPRPRGGRRYPTP